MTTPRQKIRKLTKTLSGVTPIAVALPPRRCNHGRCAYCPSFKGVSQSYTSQSSTIQRAIRVSYDPYKQVEERVNVFRMMGQPIEKIELIILGGTFMQYSPKFQKSFIKSCFDALNGKKSKTLKAAQKLNESSERRCIALCVETRPDNCTAQDIKRMLDYGATRCELGVQAIDDSIYRRVNRGHTVQDVIDATRRLKDAGFKVGYHMMPGLPGSDATKDLEMFKEIFANEDFRPDQIKIYPTQIVRGSALAKTYEKLNYKTYTNKEFLNLLIKLKQLVPKYCRIMRVMRELHGDFIIGESLRLDLRKAAQEKMEDCGLRCKCIRCREYGFIKKQGKRIDENLSLKRLDYDASGSKEIFLEISNKDEIIFAMCRLRLLKDALMVRELHVYGPQLKIGQKEEKAIQHKGFGSRLMAEAEAIAKKLNCKKIKVISGVGVRNYYKKMGYKLEETYMSKKI